MNVIIPRYGLGSLADISRIMRNNINPKLMEDIIAPAKVMGL